MRTTKNFHRVPRLLVRICEADRTAMTEKEIITDAGEKISICLRAPASAESEDLSKFEWSVKIGRVIGLSPGCAGYKVGDLVIMDYVVDCDADYLVEMDGQDKIVTVPCETVLHKKAIYSTSYGTVGKERTRLGTHRQVFKYTGEVNRLIAAPGDVDQLSLILGIIRQGRLVPNDHYLFCRKEPEKSPEMQLVGGLFSYQVFDDTHITRQVLFASPHSGFREGDIIIAAPGSSFDLRLFNQEFDIVPVHEVMAYINQSEMVST